MRIWLESGFFYFSSSSFYFVEFVCVYIFSAMYIKGIWIYVAKNNRCTITTENSWCERRSGPFQGRIEVLQLSHQFFMCVCFFLFDCLTANLLFSGWQIEREHMKIQFWHFRFNFDCCLIFSIFIRDEYMPFFTRETIRFHSLNSIPNASKA